MQVSKSISIIPKDMHSTLPAQSSQLHPVSLGAAVPRARGRLLAESRQSDPGTVGQTGRLAALAKMRS